MYQVVQLPGKLDEADRAFQIRAERGMECRDKQRGRYAFPRDVCNRKHYDALLDRDDVVKIAADRLAGQRTGGSLVSRDYRERLGNKPLLDLRGDLKLFGGPLMFQGSAVQSRGRPWPRDPRGQPPPGT